MQTKTCPECGDDIYVAAKSHKCGWQEGRSVGSGGSGPSRWAELAEQAKRRYLEEPPTSYSLTEQQWYNVCKFWPNVAVHCKRPRSVVGPDHPLDATAREGPLMRRIARRGDDPDAVEERAALQAND